jgi:hypothetical protein
VADGDDEAVDIAQAVLEPVLEGAVPASVARFQVESCRPTFDLAAPERIPKVEFDQSPPNEWEA